MNEYYGLSAIYSFEARGLAAMRDVQLQLHGIIKAVQDTTAAVNKSGLASQFRGEANRMEASTREIVDNVRQVGQAAQGTAKDLKPLRSEFKALRAEAKLIDFGSDLVDPSEFKEAARQVHTYIGALKDLETQVGKDNAAEREFAATLKNQQKVAASRIEMADQQRKAAIAAERLGVAQAVKGMGTAILQGVSAPMQAAQELQQSLGNVAKLTDDMKPGGLEEVRNSILNLSASMAVADTQIASVYEDLAGAGKSFDKSNFIERQKEINQILKNRAALDISTGAATQLDITAGSIYKNSLDQYGGISGLNQRLGSSINELADKLHDVRISAEDVIPTLNVVMNTVGDSRNFNPAQITAYAAAVSSLGTIEPEAAGSFFNRLSAAIAGNASGFATKLGYESTQAFEEALNADKLGVVTRIAKTYKDLEGGELVKGNFLQGLGLASVQDQKLIQGLANQYNVLVEAQTVSAEGFQKGTSVNREFNNVSKTGAFRAQQFTQAVKALKDTFGLFILDALSPFMQMATSVIQGVLQFTQTFPGLTKAIALITVALGAAAAAAGTAGIVLFSLQQAGATASLAMLTMQRGMMPLTGFYQTATEAFTASNPIAAAFSLIRSQAIQMTGPLYGVSAAVETVGVATSTFLLSPLGLAIAALSGLYLFLELATPQVNLLGTALGALSAPFAFLIGMVKGFTSEFMSAFAPIGSELGETFGLPLQILGDALTQARKIFDNFEGKGEAFGKHLAQYLTNPIKTATTVIGLLWQLTVVKIQNTLKPFADFVARIGQLLVHNLAENSPGPTEMIRNLWAMTINFVRSKLQDLAKFAVTIGTAIGNGISGGFDSAGSAFNRMRDAVSQGSASLFKPVGDFLAGESARLAKAASLSGDFSYAKSDDQINELLARKIAYLPAKELVNPNSQLPAVQNAQSFLKSHNLQIDQVINDDKTGFTALGLKSTIGDASRLIIQGTNSLGDILEDAVGSIGDTQFAANKEAIGQWLQAQKSATGQTVDIVGHSLGGALSQSVGAEFTPLVKSITAFSPAGVKKEEVARYNANAEMLRAAGEAVPQFRAFIKQGDVVSAGGAQYLPGEANIFSDEGHRNFAQRANPMNALTHHVETLLETPDQFKQITVSTDELNSSLYHCGIIFRGLEETIRLFTTGIAIAIDMAWAKTSALVLSLTHAYKFLTQFRFGAEAIAAPVAVGLGGDPAQQGLLQNLGVTQNVKLPNLSGMVQQINALQDASASQTLLQTLGVLQNLRPPNLNILIDQLEFIQQEVENSRAKTIIEQIVASLKNNVELIALIGKAMTKIPDLIGGISFVANSVFKGLRLGLVDIEGVPEWAVRTLQQITEMRDSIRSAQLAVTDFFKSDTPEERWGKIQTGFQGTTGALNQARSAMQAFTMSVVDNLDAFGLFIFFVSSLPGGFVKGLKTGSVLFNLLKGLPMAIAFLLPTTVAAIISSGVLRKFENYIGDRLRDTLIFFGGQAGADFADRFADGMSVLGDLLQAFLQPTFEHLGGILSLIIGPVFFGDIRKGLFELTRAMPQIVSAVMGVVGPMFTVISSLLRIAFFPMQTIFAAIGSIVMPLVQRFVALLPEAEKVSADLAYQFGDVTKQATELARVNIQSWIDKVPGLAEKLSVVNGWLQQIIRVLRQVGKVSRATFTAIGSYVIDVVTTFARTITPLIPVQAFEELAAVAIGILVGFRSKLTALVKGIGVVIASMGQYFETEGFLKFGIRAITPIDLLASKFTLLGKSILKAKLRDLTQYTGMLQPGAEFPLTWLDKLRFLLPVQIQLFGSLLFAANALYLAFKLIDRDALAGLPGVGKGLVLIRDALVGFYETVLPGFFKALAIGIQWTAKAIGLGSHLAIVSFQKLGQAILALQTIMAGFGFIINGLTLPFRATRENVSELLEVVKAGGGIEIPGWAVATLDFFSQFQGILRPIIGFMQTMGDFISPILSLLEGLVVAIPLVVFVIQAIRTKNPLKTVIDTLMALPRLVMRAFRVVGFLKTEITQNGVEELEHQIAKQSFRLRVNPMMPEYERDIQQKELQRRKDLLQFQEEMDKHAVRRLKQGGTIATGDRNFARFGRRDYSEEQLAKGRRAIAMDDQALRRVAMASGVEEFAKMAKDNQLERLRLLQDPSRSKQFIESGAITSKVMNVNAENVSINGGKVQGGGGANVPFLSHVQRQASQGRFDELSNAAFTEDFEGVDLKELAETIGLSEHQVKRLQGGSADAFIKAIKGQQEVIQNAITAYENLNDGHEALMREATEEAKMLNKRASVSGFIQGILGRFRRKPDVTAALTGPSEETYRARTAQLERLGSRGIDPAQQAENQRQLALLEQFTQTPRSQQANMGMDTLSEVARIIGLTPNQSMGPDDIVTMIQANQAKKSQAEMRLRTRGAGGITGLLSRTNIDVARQTQIAQVLREGELEDLKPDEIAKIARAAKVPIAQLYDPARAVTSKARERSAMPLRQQALAEMMEGANFGDDAALMAQVSRMSNRARTMGPDKLLAQLNLLKRGQFERMEEDILLEFAKALSPGAQGTRREMANELERRLAAQTLLPEEAAPGLLGQLRQRAGAAMSALSPAALLGSETLRYQSGRTIASAQVTRERQQEEALQAKRRLGLQTKLESQGKDLAGLQAEIGQRLSTDQFDEVIAKLIRGEGKEIEADVREIINTYLGTQARELYRLEQFVPTQTDKLKSRAEEIRAQLTEQVKKTFDAVRNVTTRVITTAYQAMEARIAASDAPPTVKKLAKLPGQASAIYQRVQADRAAYQKTRDLSLQQLMKAQSIASFGDLRTDLKQEGLSLKQIESFLEYRQGQGQTLQDALGGGTAGQQALEAIARVFEIEPEDMDRFKAGFTTDVIDRFPVHLAKQMASGLKTQIGQAAKRLQGKIADAGKTGLQILLAQVGPTAYRFVARESRELALSLSGVVGAARAAFPKFQLLRQIEARMIVAGDQAGRFFDSQAEAAAALNAGPVIAIKRIMSRARFAAIALSAQIRVASESLIMGFRNTVTMIQSVVNRARATAASGVRQLFVGLGNMFRNLFTSVSGMISRIGERSRKQKELDSITQKSDTVRRQTPGGFGDMLSQKRSLDQLEQRRNQLQQELGQLGTNEQEMVRVAQEVQNNSRNFFRDVRDRLQGAFEKASNFFRQVESGIKPRRPKFTYVERRRRVPMLDEQGIPMKGRFGQQLYERGVRQTRQYRVLPLMDQAIASVQKRAQRTAGAVANYFAGAAQRTRTAWQESTQQIQGKNWISLVRRAAWTGAKIVLNLNHSAADTTAAAWERAEGEVKEDMHQMAETAEATGSHITQAMGQSAKRSEGFFSHLSRAIGGVGRAGMAVGGAVTAAGFAAQTISFSLTNMGILDEQTSAAFYKVSELFTIVGAVGGLIAPIFGAIASTIAAIIPVGITLITAVFSPIGLTIAAIAGSVALLNFALNKFFGIDLLGMTIGKITALTEPLREKLQAPFNEAVDSVQKKWQGLVDKFGPLINPIIQPAVEAGQKLVSALADNSPGPTHIIPQKWETATDSVIGSMGKLPPEAAIAGNQTAQNLSNAFADASLEGKLAFKIPDIPTPLIGAYLQSAESVADKVGDKVTGAMSGTVNALKNTAATALPILNLFDKTKALSAGIPTAPVETGPINRMTGKPMAVHKPTFTRKERVQNFIKPVTTAASSAVSTIAASPLLPVVAGVAAVVTVLELLTPKLNVVGSIIGALVAPFGFIYGLIKGIVDRLTFIPKITGAISTKVGYLGDTIQTIQRFFQNAELAGELMGDRVGSAIMWAATRIRMAWEGMTAWFSEHIFSMVQPALDTALALIGALNHNPTIVIPESWRGAIESIEGMFFGWLGTGNFIAENLKKIFDPTQIMGNLFGFIEGMGSHMPDWLKGNFPGLGELMDWFKGMKKEKPAETLQGVTFDYSNILTKAIDQAKKSAYGDEALNELRFALQSTGGMLTAEQISGLMTRADTGQFVVKAQTQTNQRDAITRQVTEQIEQTEEAVNAQLTSLGNEWSDRMDYLNRTGFTNIGALFAPGAEQMRSSLGLLADDTWDFAKRAGKALVTLNFTELNNSLNDYSGNFGLAVSGIMQGFQSMQLSAIAFGLWSLLSMSPVVGIMLVIGLGALAIAKNFLGLRTILVGIGKVAVGLWQIISATVRGVMQVFRGIGTMIRGITSAIRGDFTLMAQGISQVFEGIRTVINGWIQGVRTVIQGVVQVIRGILEGLAQVFRRVFNVAVAHITGPINALRNLRRGARLIGNALKTAVTQPMTVWRGFLNLLERIRVKVAKVMDVVSGTAVGRAVQAVKLRATGKAGSMAEARSMVDFDQRLKGREPGLSMGDRVNQAKKKAGGFLGQLLGRKEQAQVVATVKDEIRATQVQPDRASGVTYSGNVFGQRRDRANPRRPGADRRPKPTRTMPVGTGGAVSDLAGSVSFFAPALAAPLMAVSAITTGFTAMKEIIGDLPSILKVVKTGFSMIWVTLQPLLAGIMTALAPIAPFILAIAAAVGLLYLAFRFNFLGFGDLVRGVIDGFHLFFDLLVNGIGSAVGGVFGTLGAELGIIWSQLKQLGASILEPFQPLLNLFGGSGGGQSWLTTAIKAAVAVILLPLRVVATTLIVIIKLVSWLIQGLIRAGQIASTVLLFPFRIQMGLLQGIKGVLGWMWQGVINVGQAAANFLLAPFRFLLQLLQQIGSYLSGPLKWIPGIGTLLGNRGGPVEPKRFASGGPVSGPGGGTSDRVPAMLSNGEYVINAAAASQHFGLLEAINNGTTVSAPQVMPPTRTPIVMPPTATGAAGGSEGLLDRLLEKLMGAAQPQFVFQIENINLGAGSGAEAADEFLDAIEPKMRARLRVWMREMIEMSRGG